MFVAVYDASVLYPAATRDLLIRLAGTGLFHARWTETILDEMTNAIIRTRPDLDPQRLNRTRELMCEAVPDCLVRGFEDLIPSLELPDPDDRHVLAGAIRAGAQVIVTSNLKDFPDDVLNRYGMEAQSPDEFVTNLVELSPGAVVRVVEQQAADLSNPPRTMEELLDLLATRGLARAVAALRSYL